MDLQEIRRIQEVSIKSTKDRRAEVNSQDIFESLNLIEKRTDEYLTIRSCRYSIDYQKRCYTEELEDYIEEKFCKRIYSIINEMDGIEFEFKDRKYELKIQNYSYYGSSTKLLHIKEEKREFIPIRTYVSSYSPDDIKEIFNCICQAILAKIDSEKKNLEQETKRSESIKRKLSELKNHFPES